MKVVLSSASEAEIGALFENTKCATILRMTIEEMGYPQPPTPVQTDNSMACGIANDNIKQQRSRAIDMRFYWVRDRVKQNQFHIYWGPGKLNLVDYYSKHHPPAHHQQIQSTYLYYGNKEQCNALIAVRVVLLCDRILPTTQFPIVPIGDLWIRIFSVTSMSL
jgi:predicted transposase YdaD